MRIPRRFAFLLFVAPGAAMALSAQASSPPLPDFYWPYGRVQDAGANLAPEVQPLFTMVNGRVCGVAETTVAAAAPGIPAADTGKTVYVVDVAADGTGPGQFPGCGRPGDTVVFYFPLAARLAVEQPAFQQGGARVDLELGPALSFRLLAPLPASDGVP